MTAQFPDVIQFDEDDQSYSLCSNPLESWLATLPERPSFGSGINTALWRGYIATWWVGQRRLFLKNVADIKLPELFADHLADFPIENGRIFASWYSGELRIPEGKEVAYVHMGYESVYERDRILTVWDGHVVLDETVSKSEDRVLRHLPILEHLRPYWNAEEWTFLADVFENPIDPERRHVYADWLSDRDDPLAPLLRINESPDDRKLGQRQRSIRQLRQLEAVLEEEPRPSSVSETLLRFLPGLVTKPDRIYEHMDKLRQMPQRDRILLRCLNLLPCEHLMWSWSN